MRMPVFFFSGCSCASFLDAHAHDDVMISFWMMSITDYSGSSTITVLVLELIVGYKQKLTVYNLRRIRTGW